LGSLVFLLSSDEPGAERYPGLSQAFYAAVTSREPFVVSKRVKADTAALDLLPANGTQASGWVLNQRAPLQPLGPRAPIGTPDASLRRLEGVQLSAMQPDWYQIPDPRAGRRRRAAFVCCHYPGIYSMRREARLRLISYLRQAGPHAQFLRLPALPHVNA
jgi:hypothetical protein